MAVEERRSSVEVTEQITPTKPKHDDREFMVFRLPNGLRCTLVSDSEGDMAAASMCVGVGFMKDTVPGLAHFCEHMLFLGTEKYPSEDEYADFIVKHGGSNNAYTSKKMTNYHFEVKKEQLHGALERLSQFFIAPLFNQSATDRELNAINSEFENGVQNDSWRLYHLQNTTADADHPYSNFGCGNTKSLIDEPKEKNLDMRTLLLEFHEKWYSPSIMNLAVAGTESLEELKDWVCELFGEIPEKEIELNSNKTYGNPYSKTCGFEYQVVSVTEKFTVTLHWPGPQLFEPNYTQRLDGFLGFILGHEGHGSVLHYLKNLGWATGVSGGVGSETAGFACMEARVTLTSEGFQHCDEIIVLLLQFNDVLKNTSDEKLLELYEEFKSIEVIEFEFKKKEEPQNYVTRLSNDMHFYKPEHTCSRGIHEMKLDLKLFREIISHISPDNMRIFKESQEYKGKTEFTEEIYNIEYNQIKISEEQLEQWKNLPTAPEGLHISNPNPFICNNFELVSDLCDNPPTEKSVPTKIYEEGPIELWYKKEDTFFKPKAKVSMRIASKKLQGEDNCITPRAYCLARLVIVHFNFFVSKFGYDAELAGFEYSLSHNRQFGALSLTCFGFRQKLQVFLEHIFDLLVGLGDEVEESIFNTMRSERIRALKNILKTDVYHQAISRAGDCLEDYYITIEQQIVALEDITFEDFQGFLKNLYGEGSLRMLISGDITENSAIELAEMCQQKLQMKPHKNLFSPACAKLEPGADNEKTFKFHPANEEEKNSCAITMYQIEESIIGTAGYLVEAKLRMVCAMFEEAFFHDLRTTQQLGYVVFSWRQTNSGVSFFITCIQSPKCTPTYIYERTQIFLGEYQSKLEEMCNNEELFQEYKEGIRSELLKKPLSRPQEHNTFWGEIGSGTYIFDRKKLVSEQVDKLSPIDVIEFYRAYLNPESDRKMINVFADSQLENPEHKSENERDIGTTYGTTIELRSSYNFYPRFYS